VIRHPDHTVSFKAWNGKYLTATADGKVLCKDQMGNEAKFKIPTQPKGIRLLTHYATYIATSLDGKLSHKVGMGHNTIFVMAKAKTKEKPTGMQRKKRRGTQAGKDAPVVDLWAFPDTYDAVLARFGS